MKLNGMEQVNEFKAIVNNAHGSVWIEDGKGGHFDLKDEINQYRVIGTMLSQPENDFELFASDYDDDYALESFFMRNHAA